MLSGTIFTGESMQIYRNDNQSFQSCQLGLETQPMKTRNENVVSWQGCVHTDMHTCRYTDTDTQGLTTILLWAQRQIAFLHIKGQNWHSFWKEAVNLRTLQLLKGGHQYKTWITSDWITSRWTDRDEDDQDEQKQNKTKESPN